MPAAQWFGESWGAPVCDPGARVDTPVGEPCVMCGRAIEAASRGLVIDCLLTLEPISAEYDGRNGLNVNTRRPMHLECFLENIGAGRG